MRKSAQELRGLWVVGNEYLQSAAPWTVFKADPDRAAAIIRFALNLIRFYAVVSRPFLPDTSDTMLGALGCPDANWPDDTETALKALCAGAPFTVPPVLFAKIDDAARQDLESRFAGSGD